MNKRQYAPRSNQNPNRIEIKRQTSLCKQSMRLSSIIKSRLLEISRRDTHLEQPVDLGECSPFRLGVVHPDADTTQPQQRAVDEAYFPSHVPSVGVDCKRETDTGDGTHNAVRDGCEGLRVAAERGF